MVKMTLILGVSSLISGQKTILVFDFRVDLSFANTVALTNCKCWDCCKFINVISGGEIKINETGQCPPNPTVV